MSKVSGIYSITHKASGKMYIGSAVNISSRWSRHKTHLRNNVHNCKPLQNAWNKYGEGEFDFVIEEVVEDILFLLAREQFWLWRVEPYLKGVGYNCCVIAGSTAGIKYSEESKKKISDSTKRAHEEGVYLQKSQNQVGVPLSEEHKAKISAAGKGRIMSEETRAKISASRKGKKYPRLTTV